MMAKVYRMKYCGTAIDCLFMYNPQLYGLYPSLFNQTKEDSDIQTSMMPNSEVKRNLLRLNEHYATQVKIFGSILLPVVGFYFFLLYLVIGLWPTWVLGSGYWVGLLIGLGLMFGLWIYYQ